MMAGRLDPTVQVGTAHFAEGKPTDMASDEKV